jgi:hypothetical protein
LIHQRVALAAVRRNLAALLRVLADLGTRHADDVMPDFTYLQHAQPTTLGHFLLGFAAPLRRDAERLALEAALLDESPAGAASTNGARLPLDRERMRVLLGFRQVNVHSRDAMWRRRDQRDGRAGVDQTGTGASPRSCSSGLPTSSATFRSPTSTAAPGHHAARRTRMRCRSSAPGARADGTLMSVVAPTRRRRARSTTATRRTKRCRAASRWWTVWCDCWARCSSA